jgi:hypothetical protein
VQLFGWLGLAILGVTFHAMAHLFDTATPPARLTWTVLGLQLAGVGFRLAAPLVPWAPRTPGGGGAWLLLAAALAFLGAFGVTLAAHVRTLPRRPPARRAPAVLARFLLTGLTLWGLALLVNLAGAVQSVRQGTAGAGALAPLPDALVVALASGGLATVALGMSLRVVVGWLDLPAPDLRRASQAWWPLAGAITLRAVRPAVEALAPPAGTAVAVLGATLWVAAVLWYLPALRGLWAPAAVRPGGGARGEGDPPLARFVRAAYAWLGVSALLAGTEALLFLLDAPAPAAAVADAGRHSLLFGFLGLLTAGLTGRLPTAFLDVGDLGVAVSRRAYEGAFWLLVVSSALRVVAALLGVVWPTGYAAALVAAGTTGSLGLCCLLVGLARIGWLASGSSGSRWRARSP